MLFNLNPYSLAIRNGDPALYEHVFIKPVVFDSLENDKEHMVTDIALSRSEEHTSELQSLMRISYAVFCLKQQNHNIITNLLKYIQIDSRRATTPIRYMITRTHHV